MSLCILFALWGRKIVDTQRVSICYRKHQFIPQEAKFRKKKWAVVREKLNSSVKDPRNDVLHDACLP